jgi:outer membrane receptor protein involved in Fe transport
MAFLRSIAISLFAFGALGIAYGQSQEGRILGTVTDQSGGLVRGAQVTITNTDTGVARTLETNDAGDYVAPSLPPGPYKLVVEATGFKKIDRSGIRLEVAKDIRIDLTMQPGSVSETVTVTEQVPLVETTNDTLGGTFANKSINDLPLNGRDFQNLVVLRPGVQRTSGGGFLSISSNGNRPEDNNFIVDGTDNNDPYYAGTVINAEGVQGTPGSILPIDAIQEFNAEENPPAEYGWKPGAIVNVGLKSGTNDVHGSAYDFERNNAFDARNFFNPKIDPGTSLASPQRGLRLHQFGGSLGGRIVKNKTFIFGAYEAIRAQVGNSFTANSPTTVASSLAGGDPLNSIPDAEANIQARCATSSKACGVNALSLKLAPLYPANRNPTTDGINNAQLNIGLPNKNRNDNFIIKADHHFNERNSLTARYFFGDSLQTEFDIPVLRAEWESQSKLRAQVFGLSYNFIPNARLVNEARFGYVRFWQTILTADHAANPVTVYGINTGVTTPVNFGLPEIDVDGFNQLGGNHGWPLLTTPNRTLQGVDNVSYTRGKHTFRFGGEFRHGSTDNIRDRYGKGRIRFRGGELSDFCGCYGTGASTPLEDFLSGFPRGKGLVRLATGGRIFVGNSSRHVYMNSFGAFLQDDWRVTPRLTVNAGVRYDLNTVIKESQDRLANFDPATGVQQVGHGISSPYNGDHNNFAPRLGISWDPGGKGKTVIRAGGSVIYEIPHLSIFLGQNGVNNASTAGLNVIPTASSTGIPGANGTIAASAVNVSGSSLNWSLAGPVFNTTIDCTATPCDILGVTKNLRTPYVLSWNLNVQHALTSTMSLQVGYVGNRGVKLYGVRDINQVNPNSPAENSFDANGNSLNVKSNGVLIACGHCEQAGRPFNLQFPYLAFINFLNNGYSSTYHALQATLTQRAWKGLNFVMGYTYAHAIDDVSLNRAQQPQDSTRPGLERANSDNDVRHRLTLALTYELPSRTGYGHLREGWQVNSIVTIQGGLPWNLDDGFISGSDFSLTGEFSDRWNITGSPANFKPSTSGIPYVGPSLFTVDANPKSPTFGHVTGGTNAASNTCFADAGSQGAKDQLASLGCYVAGLSALTPPASGTFGNAGRNPFRGPRLDNLDFSIVKNTKLTERLRLQLRGEFFNVLNHPHFANPNTQGFVDPSDPSTFGFIKATPDVAAANPVIGTGGPRNIQLGLKFTF